MHHPRRGDRGAYERYLDGMDATMRQKVALTAAHFLFEGRVADLGMGSGTGSYALAALYPALEVVGVDLDPEMVRIAAERYRLPNLSFVEGDIAGRFFPPRHLDGILLSSVLHHVTTFGGYTHDNARAALDAAASQLKPHGVVVVRDFVALDGRDVWLDLDTRDGDESDDPSRCSSAALLERFAGEFRRGIDAPRKPGFALACVDVELSREAPAASDGAPGSNREENGPNESSIPPLREGFRRYRLALRHALEFVLRKDYRESWANEVLEEYTYFTQAQFESCFAALGLRVLASTPIYNPWIERHRFEDRFEWWDLDGQRRELPPSNYVIVGERVGAGEGVSFRRRAAEPRGYLVKSCYERDDQRIFDLVRRPNATVDALPWFLDDGDLFVLARRSYPRPILSAATELAPSIDDCQPPPYVTEPLVVLQRDRPLGQTVEDCLVDEIGLSRSSIRRFEIGSTVYPSPGGVQEEVRAVFVEIEPCFVQRPLVNRSGFSASGVVRAIEGRQLLRAAQVGGLPDARLELSTYDLLRRRGIDPGPWIGEQIDLLGASPDKPLAATPTPLDDLWSRPSRRRFRPVESARSSGFLDVRAATFDELACDASTVASQTLEFVVPTRLSPNTAVVAPLLRLDGRVAIGVDDDDLPAAQCFTGNSELLVAPAWRLPKAQIGLRRTRAFLAEKLRAEYGLEARRLFRLGGSYYPSAGQTPEVAHPFVADISSIQAGALRTLRWIDLAQLVQHAERLRDGHLAVIVRRAAHALAL